VEKRKGIENKVESSSLIEEVTDGNREINYENVKLPSVMKNSIPKSTTVIEQMVEQSNMQRAYERVVRNGGSPGIDNMTVEDMKPYLQEHWNEIKSQLLKERYTPKVVRQVKIPKPNGGERLLGIPTVVDRLLQQALYQVLNPYFEPEFSEYSYGFREGKSAQEAVKQSMKYQAEGKRWVVDMDLEKFFDEVNHDRLIMRIKEKVNDRGLLKLLKEDLNPLIRGWINYFKQAEVKQFAEDLDCWIRHKLRNIIWRQWKRPKTRYKKLLQYGLEEQRARQSAFNGRGAWWNSGTSHMNECFKKKYFANIGLFSMLDFVVAIRNN